MESALPASHLYLREEEVVKLMQEFLNNRLLHISQLSVERETGIINASLSDDLLFLRQMILDGQWDDVLDFIQPLTAIKEFDSKRFHFEVLKVKYAELLCIKSEAGVQDNMDEAVEEVVRVLNELERYCSSKEEYSSLCLLLTLPRLDDHSQYKDWNPSSARIACFKTVLPLVERFLPSIGDKKKRAAASGGSASASTPESARNDRLMQLIIRGILYESCVQYCHQRATSETPHDVDEMKFSRALSGTEFCDSDLSLISWLQCLPVETFSCPFEQRTLNVEVERLEKPQLDALWTEYMLVTPIKPKTFPHSAMTFSRPKSADVMSRSLNPQLERLPLGLGNVRATGLSAGDIMSQSYTSFHLTGKKTMDTSVDRLFDFQQQPADSSLTVGMATTVPAASGGNLTPISEKREGARSPMSAAAASRVSDSLASSAHTTAGLASSSEDTGSSSAGSVKPARRSPTKEGDASATADHKKGYNLYQDYQRQRDYQSRVLEYEQRRAQYSQRLLSGGGGASAPRVGSPEAVYQTVAPVSSGPAARVVQPPPPLPQPNRPPNVHPAGPGYDSRLNGVGVARPPPSGMYAPPPPHHHHQQQLHHPLTSSAAAAGPPAVTNNGVYQAINISRLTSQHQMHLPPSAGAAGPHPPHHFTAAGLSGFDPSQTDGDGGLGGRSRFIPVTSLEDVQAVRCAEFHPSGKLYAVGSNSKTLRICAYPNLADLRDEHVTSQPNVLFKRTKHHKGSIYCLAWSPAGDLIATGSNDKTIKLMRFNSDSCNVEGDENELSMHDGTVRDVCFIEDMSNKSSLLVSGGAGDCRIWVTDCVTGTSFQSFTGHTGHILALYTWGGAMFVSGSQDRSVRFWDLRSRNCVNVMYPSEASTSSSTGGGGGKGSPVASVVVDPSGRLMATGQEDSLCTLYDIRGGRGIQSFRPHQSDVRSVRFSPSAFYLLTTGYDHRLVLTNMQGDLTAPLQCVPVAEHRDKVITGRWHPHEFSFISTSADKMCTLWSMPPK